MRVQKLIDLLVQYSLSINFAMRYCNKFSEYLFKDAHHLGLTKDFLKCWIKETRVFLKDYRRWIDKSCDEA